MEPLTLYVLDLHPDVPAAQALRRVPPRDAAVTASDLSATRGDGIFETAAVLHGRPQAMRAHLDRFARSARMLDLPEPRRALWQAAVDAAAHDMRDTARTAVKFVMSRGDDANRGVPTGWALGYAPHNRVGDAPPELDVVTLDRGYRHDVAQTSPWLLQGAKTLSYAVNMAALREARRRGAHDVIFTSIDGYVLEGPNSTVVARVDGVYVTVPTELGVLPGTTQADAFAALAAAGHRTTVRALRADALRAADALWLCSSTRGMAPVRRLDGVPYDVDAAITASVNGALDGREG